MDWLRMVVPVDHVTLLLDEYTKKWGVGESGRGRFFCKHSMSFLGGELSVHWSDKLLVVECTGSFCRRLGPDLKPFAFGLRRLGGYSTRLDVALDYRGWQFNGLNLLQCVKASCQAKQLCRARTYRHVLEEDLLGTTGEAIYVGRRGSDGSGRFLRVYDKGLECLTEPRGAWIRWEVEFTADCADAVLLAFVEGQPSDLLAAALGAFDFRYNTGEAELARRERVPWFEYLLGGVHTVCVRKDRRTVTADSWRAWIRDAVAPQLRLIESAEGIPLETLIRALCEGSRVGDRVWLAKDVASGLLAEGVYTPPLVRSPG